MSVCDPVTGMHSIFKDVLHKNLFAPSPTCRYDEVWRNEYIKDFKQILELNHQEIVAVIVEPIVQGAGGMNIYSPEYLKALKKICDEFDVLVIFDEIATGFGRTGKLFAYEHADVIPDILCVGKALTGGYMTLGATITNKKVVQGVEANNNILMHGPTFMANPLACSVANASLELLLNSPWKKRIEDIQSSLHVELKKCENLEVVKELRILGAIGVLELHENVNLAQLSKKFVKEGVWVRPFLNLVYIMPPFIISKKELKFLCNAIYNVLKS